MVAPIITFVFAALVGFLTWSASTVESYAPPDDPEPAAEVSAELDEEPAEEPAEEEEDSE